MHIKTDVAIVFTDEEAAEAKKAGATHIIKETSSAGMRFQIKKRQCDCSPTQVCDTCGSWKAALIK